MGNNGSIPVSHTKNNPVTIKLEMQFPLGGVYHISGISSISGLNFELENVVIGETRTTYIVTSTDSLIDKIGKHENVDIQWTISNRSNNGNWENINNTHSQHTIYVINNRPKALTQFKKENFVSDLRLEKCAELMNYQFDDDVGNIARAIKEKIEIELSWTTSIREDYIKMNETPIWYLFDQKETQKHLRMKAQCNEQAVLFASVMNMLGLDAIYYQILPSVDSGSIRLWNVDNVIPVPWYLNNADSTVHHNEDEIQYHAGLDSFVYVNVSTERLLFKFSGEWNEGEGSVFINNEMYPMLSANFYISYGIDPMHAARAVMMKFDADEPRPYHLQLYRVTFKYAGVEYVAQCKHPTDFFEGIPEL